MRFSTRHLFSRHSIPCPLTNFVQRVRDSLTAFYENILKKTCAGGRPVAKPLIRKFVTKAAPGPVPEDPPSSQAGADDNTADPAVEPPADAVELPSTAPALQAPEKVAPQTPPAKAPPKGGPAARGGRGRS